MNVPLGSIILYGFVYNSQCKIVDCIRLYFFPYILLKKYGFVCNFVQDLHKKILYTKKANNIISYKESNQYRVFCQYGG